MRLLTSNKKITEEFKRLMSAYSEYYWASAWAGVGFDCFTELKRNEEKIRRIVVGTQFDQTHPEFIENFMSHKNVRFKKQVTGTFHPKIYLFKDYNDNWELLIGSMNFTSAGFDKNTEAMLLITKHDDIKSIYHSAIELINGCWEDAEYFSNIELEKYRKAWKNQRRLHGFYEEDKPGKPISRVEIMNLSWQEFVQRVKTEDEYHSIDGRLALLDGVNDLFKKYPHFSKMSEEDRKAIAGFLENKKEGIEWLWFGSMKGNGTFKREINSNNRHISLALDKIPLKGEITKDQFERYTKKFKKAFPEAKNDWMATATRLLAMKRPDTFVCFDSKNQKKLCKDFGIKSSNMNYERYWNQIIERILDARWWKAPKPADIQEAKIWNGKAAFLDALYYEEQ
ncbi:MAG: phospholipase D family protein [Deltaproteobacteria bacterium]|nr:phospholipase D family protein [Deltaproteobacteria bacterium]